MWARDPTETAMTVVLVASLVPGAIRLPVDATVALIVGRGFTAARPACTLDPR
jgi:hypothetical protein